MKIEKKNREIDEERIFRDISLLEQYSLTDGEKAKGKVCMPTKKNLSAEPGIYYFKQFHIISRENTLAYVSL